MASPPILTVLEESQVSPSPATVGNPSLPLTFFDIAWLSFHPIHTLFFYELNITKTDFLENIVPSLKNSLSVTLHHFFPFAGKLIVFPTPTRNPEIRYEEGDYVPFTSAECTLDFEYLTGNHQRDCDQFYHLIPQLGRPAEKGSDYVTIPLFSLQVTVFPNHGFSIGMTNHHSLGDASTRFRFLKAWAFIALSGSNGSVLLPRSLPCFDRLIRHPKLDERYLKHVKIETFSKEYRPPSLSGPSDKVRVTVILTRTVIDRLKEFVSTQVPELVHVSSFTVACGYVWSCMAKSHNDDHELFIFAVDCRTRMRPPIPEAYFGNCVVGCHTIAKTMDLTRPEGFVTAAKMIGDNLHKLLTDKDGIVKDYKSVTNDLISDWNPTTIIGVAGTPKFEFYDLDFGWGKPKKHETVSIDYTGSVSVNASKESREDLEIGVCLSATKMETFVRAFDDGLQAYI